MRMVERALLVWAVIGIAGCSTASNTLEVVTEGPSGMAAGDERVNIGSASLAREIVFGEVVTRRQGLLLQAQVSLENRSKGTLALEYRWEWSDADGFQLGDTLSTWTPLTINGQERKLVSGVGPGPAAVNFRLYIRRPES